MRTIAYIIGLAIIFFVGLIAITYNQQEVTVTYYFSRSWTGRLWMIILASFVAGAVMAFALAYLSLLREKIRYGFMARKAASLEEEIKSLKQRPMPDEQPVFPAVAASITARSEGMSQAALPAKQ